MPTTTLLRLLLIRLIGKVGKRVHYELLPSTLVAVYSYIGRIVVCLSVYLWTITFELNKLKFEGQGRRSTFTIAGGKVLLKWSVRPRVRAF